jgi:hypothetical protein
MKNEDAIQYRVEVFSDDAPIEGNAMASGDDEFDAKVEAEINERLERGDVTAWCVVHAIAETDAFSGDAYLAGCTLSPDEDLERFAQDNGLFDEARDDLIRNLRAAIQNGIDAQFVLDEILGK